MGRPDPALRDERGEPAWCDVGEPGPKRDVGTVGAEDDHHFGQTRDPKAVGLRRAGPDQRAMVVRRDVRRGDRRGRGPVPRQRGQPDGRIDPVDILAVPGRMGRQDPIHSGKELPDRRGRGRPALGGTPAVAERLEERHGWPGRAGGDDGIRAPLQPAVEPRGHRLEEPDRRVKGKVRQFVLPGSQEQALGGPQAVVVRDGLARVRVVPRGDWRRSAPRSPRCRSPRSPTSREGSCASGR